MNDSQALESFQRALSEMHHGQLRATEFVAQSRGLHNLLEALPERYGKVYHDLLDRLESGALFSEESCSFSQRDLLDSLQTWADKAATQLQQQSVT
jgi:hypothetical protein